MFATGNSALFAWKISMMFTLYKLKTIKIGSVLIVKVTVTAQDV